MSARRPEFEAAIVIETVDAIGTPIRVADVHDQGWFISVHVDHVLHINGSRLDVRLSVLVDEEEAERLAGEFAAAAEQARRRRGGR